MTQVSNDNTAVYSTLGDDLDLGELVEMYVDEMPNRIATFEEAFATGDHESLQRAAHQMKGAGQSYGFDQLTLLAAVVEYAARDGEPTEKIFKALEKLIDVCQRVRAGQP